MTKLILDPSSYMPALSALPTFTDEFGLRPNVKKADLILAIAPAYVEFGKFMRSIGTFQLGLPASHPCWYIDPFPWPITEAPVELIGMTVPPGTFVLDLSDGDISSTIPPHPMLIIKVDFARSAMFCAAPLAGRPPAYAEAISDKRS